MITTAAPPREEKGAARSVAVYVRGKESPQESARRYGGDNPTKAFELALNSHDVTDPEPIMSWHSLDEIAAIDIDYHIPVGKPNPKDLESRVTHVSPAPDYYWITHGGGVRLIYFAKDGFTALEHAILAMLTVARHFPDSTGIEIKRDTRHPGYPKPDGSQAGQVERGYGPYDAASRSISRLLSTPREADPQAIEDWLEEHGMEMRQRVSHARCPIDPTPNDSKNDCVVPLDGGIFCYRCQAQGIAYPGCSKPGFVPWARLVEDDCSPAAFNHLRAAVDGLCHWEHARHIVRYHTGLQGKHAEQLYRLLLRHRHLKPEQTEPVRKGWEALIERCFYPAVPVVRVNGHWALAGDMATPCSDRGMAEIVAALPAASYVDTESGEVKRSQLKIGLLKSNGDLTAHGYPPLEPVRGADIARMIPASANWDRKDKSVPALVPSDPPFVYQSRTARERADFDYVAWIGRRFPGVNIGLLRLLIAAKGYAQLSASEPPRVLVTGQSGGGKTAHVLLAAVLTGDTVGKVPIDVDPERFLRSYATEAKRNGYVFSDEVAKSKLSATDLCARLLQVTRETTFHQLYVGSTAIGRLAVHVMADTLVPKAMREEVQLARRIVHVDLGAGVNEGTDDWRREGDIADLLTAHHEAAKNRTAAHMLVSEVIDAVQLNGVSNPTFEAYAAGLGFTLLRDAENGVDADEDFRDLFRAVIAAPDGSKGRWKGQGWKVFKPSDINSPLAKAFRACLEGASEGDYQPITGRQWGRIMDLPGLVCDVAPHHGQVGIRFRVGDPRSKTVRYNKDVLEVTQGTPKPAAVIPFIPPPPPPLPPATGVSLFDTLCKNGA